jgi:hypothetical protein
MMVSTILIWLIWLIINERSKQRELAVPAVRQQFSRQVTQRCRRRLPTVSMRSEHSVCISMYDWYRNLYNLVPSQKINSMSQK